jgi:CRAL/TRIO domain
MYIRGHDRAGHPLLYMKPRLENTYDHEGNMKHLVYTMERTCGIAKKGNQKSEKMSLLIDYEGFSLFNAPPMKTSTETLSILQNHYPERLPKAYLIRPFHSTASVRSDGIS